MINPKELMIGNVVLYDGSEVKIIELGETLCKISTKEKYLTVYPERLDPIPLTPSILERCGFVKVDELNWNYYLDNDTNTEAHTRRHLSWHLNLRELELDMNRLCFIRLKDPHLHHLQNIVKSITGKELEVN